MFCAENWAAATCTVDWKLANCLASVRHRTATYIDLRYGHFCRAMLCISAAYVVVRCPSVRMSVTFVYSVEMNKHIFKLFSPSGSNTYRSFSRKKQTLWQYSDGDPPNGGVECRWDSRQIYGFGIDDWCIVINSFDHGVKCITADSDDGRSPRISEPCLWQQGSTSF